MHRFTFYLFLFGINIFRIVPFGLIYFFGWIIYVIIYHLVGYRRDVVLTNLRKCFPEKSETELKTLSKKFYKDNLADIFVEGLKGFTMSQKQFKSRYRVVNPEILDEYYQKGQDVIALATHYGNWEWGIQAVGSQIGHQAAALYKPLSNKYVERFTKNLREKSGMKLVSIYDTLAYFQSKKEKPVIYIMAADQFPGDGDAALARSENSDLLILKLSFHAINAPIIPNISPMIHKPITICCSLNPINSK